MSDDFCGYCGHRGDHACAVQVMSSDEEREVLAALMRVTVDTPARAEFAPDAICTYSGWPSWTTADGWRVVVFNDCGDWDYIDSITAPDGRTWDYPYQPDGRAMTQMIADWSPDDGDPRGWPGAP